MMWRAGNAIGRGWSVIVLSRWRTAARSATATSRTPPCCRKRRAPRNAAGCAAPCCSSCTTPTASPPVSSLLNPSLCSAPSPTRALSQGVLTGRNRVAAPDHREPERLGRRPSPLPPRLEPRLDRLHHEVLHGDLVRHAV